MVYTLMGWVAVQYHWTLDSSIGYLAGPQTCRDIGQLPNSTHAIVIHELQKTEYYFLAGYGSLRSIIIHCKNRSSLPLYIVTSMASA